MKLEAGKTYVFKSKQDKEAYLAYFHKNPAIFSRYYEEGFKLDSISQNKFGLIAQESVIHSNEIKYFKLKEENQMDNVRNGDELAFIDSDGVYQECTVVSIYDGYAWVQKTSGKMNTVPCSKLVGRRATEEQLFINEVVGTILGFHEHKNAAKALWDLGYRKVNKDD